MRNATEHSIYQNSLILFGKQVYFRIRRLSFWLQRGQWVSPVVFGIGNKRFGVGRGIIFSCSLFRRAMV